MEDWNRGLGGGYQPCKSNDGRHFKESPQKHKIPGKKKKVISTFTEQNSSVDWDLQILSSTA